MNDFEKYIHGIASLANLLYASYAARDFFAKVIPGFVTTISVACFMGNSLALSDMKDIPFFAWILAFGVFYAAGFTIQRLGETFHIIKLYGDDWNEKAYEEKVEEFFRSKPSIYHRAQRERLVVIKEMYGNLAVSLIIVWVVLAIRFFTTSGLFSVILKTCNYYIIVNVVVFLLLGMSVVGLLRGNSKLRNSEKHWIETTLKNSETKTNDTNIQQETDKA